jgi:arginine/lysine/ornithine decarboxylase
VTSPTYEGVVSDIRSIAEVCHGAGIPLLVDEAHGAHLGLFEEGGFPTGAVRCGADLVVQSVHKTLPSLTQTALLHLQGSMIRSKEVERQLGIFETSSPSYPLMISIDSCTELLAKAGPELFGVWKERLDRFYDAVRPLRYVRVWDPDSAPESGTKSGAGSLMNRDRRDRSKIWISFRRAGLSGAEAAALLRERYGIETEMCSGDCVLAMTGCGDTDEDLHRLSEALRAVDSEAAGRERTAKKAAPQTALPPVQTACTILAAVGCEAEEVDMDEAEGRICGEYLYAYPPGIPILAPGEYIGQEHIRLIRKSGEDGNPVHHTHADHPDRIMCLAE